MQLRLYLMRLRPSAVRCCSFGSSLKFWERLKVILCVWSNHFFIICFLTSQICLALRLYSDCYLSLSHFLCVNVDLSGYLYLLIYRKVCLFARRWYRLSSDIGFLFSFLFCIRQRYKKDVCILAGDKR